MNSSAPTIKGIFVRSHIECIKREKGEEGLKLLEEKYGSSLDFKNTTNIPIRDEVRLLECAVAILHPETPKEKLAYESGKLHFNNFLTTPFAKILFPFFRYKFKLMMLQAQNIAGHVFQGVDFSSENRGENAVTIRLRHNDYPLEHFQGFFEAWMIYAELHGTVAAKNDENTFIYTMQWEK